MFDSCYFAFCNSWSFIFLIVKKSVACIILNDSKQILIAHRNNFGQMASRWEFPGGKVEDDESDIDAIEREMYEEFGIKVFVKEKITSGNFIHNNQESKLEVYLVIPEHYGNLKKYILTEHSEYKWVDYKNIPTNNFVDSDLSVYKDILKYLSNKIG